MNRYIIEDDTFVPPFNEPARELTIGLRPLKIHHEELFRRHFGNTCILQSVFNSDRQIVQVEGEAFVYRDNLWFDEEYFSAFMETAIKSGKACRAAFTAQDKAFTTYTLPLTECIETGQDKNGEPIYLLDLWYFPNAYTEYIENLIIPSDYHEIGFYSVPDFMTLEQGNLTHYAPMRAVASIESWVHIYFVSIIYGNFGRSGRLDRLIEKSVLTQLRLLWRAILDQKQILSASGAIKIGTGCAIDPSAVITGPAEIGNNVSIGAGAIIDNCTIGNDVTIDAGCVLFQSTVGNNCFLPFRASLYLTAVMENTIIAQNTCLQMCVIGRNSFVGAGNTFTDFNLVAQKPIKAANRHGDLKDVGQIVLGSAIGHNCRVGSGMVVMPGRMIESDVVLIASAQRRVVERSVTFEESDHHHLTGGVEHKRFYPRQDENVEIDDSW